MHVLKGKLDTGILFLIRQIAKVLTYIPLVSDREEQTSDLIWGELVKDIRLVVSNLSDVRDM